MGRRNRRHSVTRINHAINSLVGRISADVQRAERQPDNENARNDQPRPRHPGRQAILNRPERTNECLYIGVNGRNLAAMVIEDRLQQAAL